MGLASIGTGSKKIPVADHGWTLREGLRAVERRDWWLWVCAVLITLILTGGIVSFGFPGLHMRHPELNSTPLNDTILGLVGMVLLFDIYTVYQHFQIQGVRKQLVEREELFRLITENAADMIAVVDTNGQRLYNSPSYEKILGYTPLELGGTTAVAQIHPEDREKVFKAADDARRTGVGTSLEYRMRHKDGSWRTLESRASTIMKGGQVEKLVIVNRDVTERKHLEEQFRRQSRKRWKQSDGCPEGSPTTSITCLASSLVTGRLCKRVQRRRVHCAPASTRY